MTKYRVTVPEVWYQHYEVEAESEGEAIRAALDQSENAVEIGDLEYSRTLDNTQAYAIAEEEFNS